MHGGSSDCSGRNGEDLVIQVPPGTVIIDAKNDFVIRDLATDGDSFVIGASNRMAHAGATQVAETVLTDSPSVDFPAASV